MDFTLTPFVPIADRVWRAVAEPASINIGLVAGASGCVVIDTGSTPAQGRQIRDAAGAVAGVPVVAAVVTHHHVDHAYGLAAFDDLPTYAHASVWASICSAPTLDEELTELGMTRDDLRRANHELQLVAAIDLGDRVCEVVHFGPGHAPGDTCVLVPDARVVFAGDLLESAGPPWMASDSDLAGWPVALDGILGTLRADTVIVPGHGDPVDRVFAVNQRGQIAGIYLQLEHLFIMGATPEDVLAKGDWPFPTESFESVVGGVYQTLKARGRIGRTLKVLH